MCTHSRVGSIAALRLERFKRCKRLCLRQNLITEVDGLASLAATLRELDLYDNLVSHISREGLAPLTGLTQLDLSFNKIKHIKNIGHMTQLTDLYLVSNKVSTIENLETLTKLRMLELGSNRVREIRGLDTLSGLEELWLAKNKISSLTGLAALTKLRLLSIQSNRISDLSPLRDVPSLEELYVSQNLLEGAEVLEGLAGNARLRVLDVSGNKLTSLKGLARLEELEELWASSNGLADFADVERELSGKKKLSTVYFEGNPLQLRGPALYRNKVKLALPQIQQIDASKFLTSRCGRWIRLSWAFALMLIFVL